MARNKHNLIEKQISDETFSLIMFFIESNTAHQNIEAKSAEVPNSAASDSQKFFSNTFKADKEVQYIELDFSEPKFSCETWRKK
jgi:hypothetical protein